MINLSKFGWTIPLKNKYSQSMTDAFSQIIETSRRKPNLLETDDGKEYANKIVNKFSNKHNIKRLSRYTDKGAAFAKRFNRTIRNLLEKKQYFLQEILIGSLNYHQLLNSIKIQFTIQ